MFKKWILSAVFLPCIIGGYSQSLFYNDFSFINPGHVGMVEKNNIIFRTTEFYIGDRHNFSNANIAVYVPLKKISSGIGIHSAYDNPGLSTNFQFGAIYSFQYRMGENFSVSLGSDFSIYRYKIKGPVWTIEDDYDYVNETMYLFNADVGLWIKYKNLQLGFTYKHLNQPSSWFTLVNEEIEYKLSGYFNTLLVYDFNIGSKVRLKNSVWVDNLKTFADNKNIVINNLLEIRNKYLIGLTTDIYKYNELQAILYPNLGCKIADKISFIAALDLFHTNNMRFNGRIIEGNLIFNF